MLLKYFYDKKLAQASYMVACQVTGEALIIDPARDITPYLEAAQVEGMRIAQVSETHIHADYVSGARELAHQSGAKLYLSGAGGTDWQYELVSPQPILLYEDSSFMVGNIRVEVLHTPGHTPEHIALQITDTAGADQPMGIFTGDFLFVGDVGRPDLLEEAAGIANTKEIGARQQFQNVQRFKTLPDYLQIWPGHGAGSACGKALGAVPSTTLGYEKLFNSAFQFTDESQFVSWLLAGQPESPYYFAQMKRVNRTGPTLLSDLPQPKRLRNVDHNLVLGLMQEGLLMDTRSGDAFAAGHIPGVLHIPASSDRFNTYAGWYVDFTRPVYLIAHEHELAHILSELRAVGVDQIPGYIAPEDVRTLNTETTLQLDVHEAAQHAQQQAALILDVRGTSEYQDQHIPGVQHIPMGYVPQRLEQIPRNRQIIIHCGGGVRSQVVASILQQNGFEQVANMAGGISAWESAGLPLEKEASPIA